MDQWKDVYASDTKARTLHEALENTDVFLGLSAPNVVKPEMLEGMAKRPLILALANPVPEILPELVRAAETRCINFVPDVQIILIRLTMFYVSHLFFVVR